LCLMSCIFGETRDIFFPKLSEDLHLITFSEIAVNFLRDLGYEPHLCENEEEARTLTNELINQKKWPCLFTGSDTTGEKDFEEFFTADEILDMDTFINLGIIKNPYSPNHEALDYFTSTIDNLKASGEWTKRDIVNLFLHMIPDFDHKETGKYLDSKMLYEGGRQFYSRCI